MTVHVHVTPEAIEQALHASDWWWKNRPRAPGLLAVEVDAAIDLLSTTPDAGRRYRHPDIPGLRRLLLPKTRYHVYYVHDQAASRIVILAIWSAVRGRPPHLPGSKQ